MNPAPALPATGAELLAQAVATCRDCGQSFPFPEIDRSFVNDSDGFARCLPCRDRRVTGEVAP